MTNAPMGHGVNQRAQIKMSPEEVEEFLNERHSMTMSTISGDGTIHSVAMWYGFLEGAIAFETKAKAQKVVNLRRNPALTCLVEAMLNKRVVVKLHVDKTVTWDHRKLGLPAM